MHVVIVWLRQCAPKRLDAWFTASLLVFLTFIAVWVNEPFGVRNFSGKWEIIALITTIVSIIGYWWFEVKSRGDFPSTLVFGACQLLLILSGLAAVIAMKSVWDELGVEAWGESTIAFVASSWGPSAVSPHAVTIRVMLVGIIAMAFTAHDAMVWIWCSNPDKKKQARILCLLADAPIAAAFLVLFLFNGRYPRSWAVWPQGWELLFIREGAIYTLQYFVAGAVAFQMLVSNVVYLMITFFFDDQPPSPVS